MQKAHVHAPSNTKRNQISLWNFGLALQRLENMTAAPDF
jgi:hypothetical protein